MTNFNSMEICIIHMKNKEYAYLALEGYLSPDKLKELATRFVNLCLNHNVQKVTFDSLKINYCDQTSIRLLKAYLLPALTLCQLQKIAFIYPDNSLGVLAVQVFSEHLGQSKVKAFKSMENADDWLFPKHQEPAQI